MFACWQALKDARLNLVGHQMEIWSISPIVKVSTGAEIAKSSLLPRIRQNREASNRTRASHIAIVASFSSNRLDADYQTTLEQRKQKRALEHHSKANNDSARGGTSSSLFL